MRRYLFDRANYLKKYVILDIETDRSITFKVKDQIVRLFYKQHRLEHSCTCKGGSILVKSLCSHKLAVFYFLMENGRSSY